MARETQVSSFTVPKPLARNLRHVAKRLGVTQSALVSELLGEPLVDLRKLVDLVPKSGKVTQEQILRLRGASADVVADRVRDALHSIAGSKQ